MFRLLSSISHPSTIFSSQYELKISSPFSSILHPFSIFPRQFDMFQVINNLISCTKPQTNDDRAAKRQREESCEYGKSKLSELPTDILVTILMKLSLVDYIRVGAVCLSLRSATLYIKAQKKLHPPAHQLPSIMLSEDIETNIHTLSNLFDESIYYLHLPDLQNVGHLGSCNGWLVLVDWSGRGIFLLNPFSKERIQLPHQAKIWNLTSNTYRDVEDLWERGAIFYSKATLSSSPTSDDCTVVMNYDWNRLAFLRLGDETWIVFEGAPDLHLNFSDVTCYKGRAYAVTPGFQLMVCELGPEPKLTIQNTLLPSEKEIGADHHSAIGGIFVDWVYLVESHGELLAVLELRHPSSCLMSSGIQGFQVLKMDSNGQRWVKIESLGDRMLFLSGSCSKSLSATGLLGFEGNSIYFMDDSSCDFSVFHLQDGSIKPFSKNCYFSPKLPFIWPMPYPE